MPVAKAELALLLLCCISFALIDPPTREVDAHNTAIAPQEVLHYNALDMNEREPTLDDPTIFLYAKVLTLTPSVNGSVTSKPHPKLIWLAAEKHAPSVTETSGGDDCDRRTVTRNFDDAVLEGTAADYALDGLIKQEGNVTTFNTASKSVVLATNETFINPSEVPFTRSIGYQLLSVLNKLLSYVLGDMIDLSKYEESLAYASPYPTGTYNLTVRNVTIVNPHLNVTLTARFSINYTEHGTQQYEENGSCKTESWDDEGVLALSDSDFDSYEVQNDYITIIPYMPGLFSLDANTTEDVTYHVSVLSNSNLYKYYSVMDNQTAGAYYFNSFEVVNDSFGISRIVAVPSNHSGLLAEDNRSNYTGGHQPLYALYGNVLRSPTEFNNMTYNYSRIYDIDEMFYNLSAGRHNATLEYYTWFGNYTAPSAIDVRAQTILTLSAYPSGQDVSAFCTLTSRGVPVPGERVDFKLGDRTVRTSTDAMGRCNATLPNNMSGLLTVYGTFPGSGQLWPSSGTAMVAVQGSIGAWKGIFIDNLALLLLISGLFAISFVGFMVGQGALGGGQLMGGVFSRFFPFAPRGVPKGKPMIRVKKGKELAVSVAMVLATGGAGAAAGSKIAGQAVAKKAASGAMKNKMMKETAGGIVKKGGRNAGKMAAKKGKARKKTPAKGITILGKMALEASDEGRYQRDIMEKWKLNESKAEDLRKTVQEPHMQVIQEKIEKAVATSDDSLVHARHELNKKLDLKPELRIVGDFDFDHFLEKAYNSDFPSNTIGVTVGNVVYLRHSGVYDEKYIQEVVKHEDYHVVSKLSWDGRTRPLVEGANEIMKYEDVIRDPTTAVDKAQVCIIEGDYRKYAAQQYLVREIVGEGNFIIGHNVMGEEFLQTKFDEVAGQGQYKKIFGDSRGGEAVGLNHDERIDALKIIYADNHTKTERLRISRNVNNITEAGKYDL